MLQEFAKGSAWGEVASAVDALSHAKLSWFNWETKQHEFACVHDEQVQLLSLVGNIALRNGKQRVHAHVVVGHSDGTAHGGPLLEARVGGMCESILTKRYGNAPR